MNSGMIHECCPLLLYSICLVPLVSIMITFILILYLELHSSFLGCHLHSPFLQSAFGLALKAKLSVNEVAPCWKMVRNEAEVPRAPYHCIVTA